jgi:hypothetical protein
MRQNTEDVLQAFELLEEEDGLTHREKALMEVCRALRDERTDLGWKLAELEQRVEMARAKCRRSKGVICELYGGGD